MQTADFDYHLPPELIAQEPPADRSGARMLVLNRQQGTIVHDHVRHLGRYLAAGDLLVLNDTKVLPARIWSQDPPAEFLLVEDLSDQRWSALVNPARSAKPGTVYQFHPPPSAAAEKNATPVSHISATRLTAVVEGTTEFGGRVLRFAGDVAAYLEAHGAAPLPPYIKRAKPRTSDRERYQTVFARVPGAIAAPTAGLHFTPELLAELAAAGVPHAFITLHVGIGTFRPVKADNIEDHPMHAERFSVSAEAAAALRAARRIVTVGTTVVRALETLGEPRAGAGRTELFIRPPFSFRMAGAMLTNFHLPRSTLLMLVCAFASRDLILRAYGEAVRERYRFYSYGDCLLIV